MGLRITTWNVNGIRNPFGYQPWRDQRTFAAMFDILEADIVVFQEAKIQRKDLQDDMVLVPGWDCYFSLPKHKKGYSGVVIYTRQSVCAPIRAEEGLTGILCPPNSSTSYNELPKDQQIGGYPTIDQLALSTVDAATLDSEGRCLVLEFQAFVLLGVYSPANRDQSRDDFRLGFLNALDGRVRNLVAQGKRVVLTGDLNISREDIDTANAEETMRKNGLSGQEYVSTPARRLFNQLLIGGRVFGERDAGREKPVLWDTCRGFHPTRKGMFTCWEQKINARPGNYGSRIDYVLCSEDMKGWFCDANIQEGLLGSDHCPVFAVLKDRVDLNGEEVDIRDIMNPSGVFKNGKRLRECSMKDLPPLSGKLIPEFDRRRSIRDMFTRTSSPSTRQTEQPPDTGRSPVKPSMTESAISFSMLQETRELPLIPPTAIVPSPCQPLATPGSPAAIKSSADSTTNKRPLNDTNGTRTFKRSKSIATSTSITTSPKGQQSLRGFLKPQGQPTRGDVAQEARNSGEDTVSQATKAGFQRLEAPPAAIPPSTTSKTTADPTSDANPTTSQSNTTPSATLSSSAATLDESGPPIRDAILTKSSWSALFTKPRAPLCEGHQEPCISMLTKKSGFNCGRSFWMCARPVGPSGQKERGTQWRCPTFIWCSDWSGGTNTGGGGGGGGS